jgi:hypothetical protein
MKKMGTLLLLIKIAGGTALISGVIFVYDYICNNDLYTVTSKAIDLPLSITKDELATIEGNLPDLVNVTIICNEMDNPKDALNTSVENNAKRNVAYSFWVSPSTAQKQRRGRYLVFERHFINEVPDAATENILSLYSLEKDWDDYPYVFYTLNKNEKEIQFSYRGSSKLDSISEEYYLVSEIDSNSIYNDCKRGLKKVEFSNDSPNFIPINGDALL